MPQSPNFDASVFAASAPPVPTRRRATPLLRSKRLQALLRDLPNAIALVEGTIPEMGMVQESDESPNEPAILIYPKLCAPERYAIALDFEDLERTTSRLLADISVEFGKLYEASLKKSGTGGR